MIINLRYYGDKVLRQKAEPIAKITKEILDLIDNMIETMDSKQAIGIAAPQIGVSLRIFVIRHYEPHQGDDYFLGEPEVYINPVLSSPLESRDTLSEGCLSFPGLHLDIERPEGITVTALNREGKSFTQVLKGFKARQIMHENDHINGVLFIDRLPPKEKKKLEGELVKLKKKWTLSE